MLLRHARQRLLSEQLLRQVPSLLQCHRGFSADQEGLSSSSLDALPSTSLLEAADQVVSVSQAAEAAAIAAAHADCWFGTRKLMDFLLFAHDSLEMPWWAAITLSNTLVRLASLPATVLQQKKTKGINEMKGHVEYMKTIFQQTAQARTPAEYERCQALQKEAQRTLDTRFKSEKKWALGMPLIAIGNITLLISQFSAVSSLAKETLPSMTHEGLWWFTNLTLPDPLYGLPVACAAVTLLMLETGAMGSEMAMDPAAQQKMKWLLRVMACVVIPAGGYVSSAVGVLWVSNSVLAIMQATLLRSPAARQALGLPDLKEMAELAAAARLQAGGGGGFMSMMQPQQPQQQQGLPATPPPPGSRPARMLTGRPMGKKVTHR